MYCYTRPVVLIRTLLSALVFMSLLAGFSSAEEVKLEYNGLDLIGRLEIAEGKSINKDGVVLIIHETLSHGKTPFIGELQQGLAFDGVNSLSITLSLGMDAREGAFNCALEQNHRHKDGAEEIGVWVEWLVERGVSKVSLLGLERGGSQAALYIKAQQKLKAEQLAEIEKQKKRKRRRRRKKQAEQQKVYLDFISKLVLIGPAELTSETMYKDYVSRYNIDLGGNLFAAQKLIEGQNEQDLIEGKPFLTCQNARFTAAAFIDYYLPKPEHSVMGDISAMPYPVLVMLDSRDTLFAKYEDIVSEQLEKGVGQLAVARINGLGGNFQNLSASTIIKQILPFIKR